MDFTFRELECFTAVAEELSFTRAAQRLHLAQPPLSRHVRALEEKVGVALFERLPRGARLTPAGRRFHEESRGILEQLARAADGALRTASGENRRLRVGFVSAVATAELMEVLGSYRRTHHRVQLVLHDLPPAEQVEWIRQGRLDAGFIGLMPEDRPAGVQYTRWRKERLLAYVPAGHRLAGAGSIRMAELKDEGFITVSGEAAPAFSTRFHALCAKAGFRPRVILEAPRAQAVAVMVAAGSGVTVLPESLSLFLGRAAVALEIRDAPQITHVVASALREGKAMVKELLGGR